MLFAWNKNTNAIAPTILLKNRMLNIQKNYYNIELLNSDETIYDPSEGAKNIFIITTNGIMPETCDYIIE